LRRATRRARYGGSLIDPRHRLRRRLFRQEMLSTRGQKRQRQDGLRVGLGHVAQYTVQKLLQLGAEDRYAVGLERHDRRSPTASTPKRLAWLMDLKTCRRGRISEYADKYKGAIPSETSAVGRPCDCIPPAQRRRDRADDARTLVKNGCICVSKGRTCRPSPRASMYSSKPKFWFGPGKAANAGGVPSPAGNGPKQPFLQLRREEVDARLQASCARSTRTAASTEAKATSSTTFAAPTSRLRQVATRCLPKAVVDGRLISEWQCNFVEKNTGSYSPGEYCQLEHFRGPLAPAIFLRPRSEFYGAALDAEIADREEAGEFCSRLANASAPPSMRSIDRQHADDLQSERFRPLDRLERRSRRGDDALRRSRWYRPA